MTGKPDLEQIIESALTLHRSGALEDAIAAYLDILADHPDHAEVLNFAGLAHHQLGRHDDALDFARQAARTQPSVPEFAINLGMIEIAAGQCDAAMDTLQGLRNASSVTLPQVENLFAMAAKGAGETHLAKQTLEELTAKHPAFAGAHYNLGNIYLMEGCTRDAEACFRRCLKIEPGNRDAARNLAQAMALAGKTKDAIEVLTQISASHPDDAASLNNLGNLYRKLGKHADARRFLEQACEADPDLADAAYNLGAVLADLNNIEPAITNFQRAAALRPGFAKAEWASLFTLPQIYGSLDQVADARARWAEGIARVSEQPAPITEAENAACLDAIAEITPFGLAYHGENDLDLMERWGRHVSRIAKTALPSFAEPQPARPRDKKRVAFVSAHLRAHTVERLFSAWMTNLDPDTFDVQLVSTMGPGDARSKDLAVEVDGFHAPTQTPAALAQTLHDLNADIVVYPDVGMDPMAQVLAALPLGQCQAMSWGHPVTSGFPDMDLFLSSELMEPADGDSHYHERLIRLPGLSVAYARPEKPAAAKHRSDFLCAQSLFKVSPAQDAVFADILAECQGSSLTFISHPIADVTRAFQTRLSGALKRKDVDPDQRLVFLPPADRDVFLGYLAGADIILDTFAWSGGNTSLESFAMGTPVVTLPGRFMRGRHTLAMLTMMDIPELIAEDEDDYIRIASTLRMDRRLNAHTRDQIIERSERLFDDPAPAAALNDLFYSL